jgi:hypoxanthine phosphoribosyltransferase
MYSVSNKEYVNKGKLIDKTELLDIEGFLMGSHKKVFKIKGASIRELRITNKKLANPIASKIVFQKYNELLKLLTELLIDDDDSGDSFRVALNQIEKFRMEIKNKYRDYLLQKELEKMSKELKVLQKEAKQKLYDLQYSYLEYQNENRRSR